MALKNRSESWKSPGNLFLKKGTDPEKHNSLNQLFWILCLTKIRSEELRDYRDVIAFEKNRFQNVFRSHGNAKTVFSNFSGLNSVYEKHLFRVGLVWMVGITRVTDILKAAFSPP